MATCFVVMGFGEKTDYQSTPQRVLNLNRTYEDIIEPAVVDAGLQCIRADKIIHSTVIDKPMYEQLLDADVVIADLSTSNANAIYELGVRHALRPHCTIVIAEDRFSFPFDLNHVSIAKYEHLGKEIGYREVMRMRAELTTKIRALRERSEVDSPVHLFLPQLRGNHNGAVPEPAAAAAPSDDKSLADLLESLNEAKRAVKEPSDWLVVAALARRLRNLQPNDHFITQQLTLATYKSKHPDPLTALRHAAEILQTLKPDTCSDAETVGLWGAIHKRLWEVGRDSSDLDKAVRSYGRGYYIRDDHYNGINYAFLLNVRAAVSQGDDATADRVFARRVRAEVLSLCEAALAEATLTGDDRFWVTATKVEALFGMGRADDAEALRQRLIADTPPDRAWMVESMTTQLNTLASLTP